MGRRADYEGRDDSVWIDLEMALSRCGFCDHDKLRETLAEYGLTVVRLSVIEHAGTMLRDTLERKPMFKISFVLNPVDHNSPVVAVDFASSKADAVEKAKISLRAHSERGATGWRITDLVDRTVAIGPERT